MLPAHRQAFQDQLVKTFADPGARLAITGATGWLGLVLAHMASRAGLTTANGRLRLFASSLRALTLEGEDVAQVEALFGAPPLTGEGWRVAHFAGLGKERTSDLSPGEFARASHTILDAVLHLTDPAIAPRMIFASSGAVYAPAGLVEGLEQSPYGWMKRLHEERLAAWCAERSIPLVIARVFAVGGPHSNKRERYALASIIDAALAGQPIVLKAEHLVLRSFVHVEELVAALLAIVNDTPAGRPRLFDTGGGAVVELQALAERIQGLVGDPTVSPITRHLRQGLAEDRYVGDEREYSRLLAAMGLPRTTLDQIILDTAGR
jgi:nucleoside-diphosphate-sugar epimerase